MKPFLVRHLEGQSSGRFPVWMMRQAGRYLSSYLAIRDRYSFWERVTDPKLAVEISMLPVRELPLDAVILFSDILTLPYSLGVPIELKESVGPVLEKPLQDRNAFEVFHRFDPAAHVPYVGEALSTIRSQLDPEKAVIGFAGAPWTVATYLVEGRGKHFGTITRWLYDDPQALKEALGSLSEATLRYCRFQVEQGADMVQLFDSWIGEMPRWYFEGFYRETLQRLFSGLSELNVPVIYFSKKNLHVMDLFEGLEIDVVSVDHLMSLSEYDDKLRQKVSLQGNLDPHVLFAPESVVRERTQALREEARKLGKPAILNLGHGILPKTPVENVRAFLEEAQVVWT